MVDWIVESGRKGEGQTQVSVECGDWACPPAAALQGFKRTALTTSNSTGACRRTWTRQRPCLQPFEGQSSTRLASHTPGELLSETAFGGRAQMVAQGGEPGVRLVGDLLYRIELFLAIRAATPGPMCIWTGLGFVESIAGSSRYLFSSHHLWLVRIG